MDLGWDHLSPSTESLDLPSPSIFGLTTTNLCGGFGAEHLMASWRRGGGFPPIVVAATPMTGLGLLLDVDPVLPKSSVKWTHGFSTRVTVSFLSFFFFLFFAILFFGCFFLYF